MAEPEAETGVNLANAVDLSESEDEEEMEDIMDDFAFNQMETVCCIHNTTLAHY